jgi:hypothetical protein
MNHTSEIDDDLQPEYDFTQLTVIARGDGRKKSNSTVQLDSDVAIIESANLTTEQWKKILAKNPLFAFLRDPEEDIYTLEDGIAVSYEW